jgi:hypothetical protein
MYGWRTATLEQISALILNLSSTGLKFDRKSLSMFLSISDCGSWKGESATAWLHSVNKRGIVVGLDEAAFCSQGMERKELLHYCHREDVSDLAAVVAIFAVLDYTILWPRLVMTKRGLSFGSLPSARTTSALMRMRHCCGHERAA